MCFPINNFWRINLAGILLVLLFTAQTNAGWMGFRNDTKDTLVVQEIFVVNGQQRPGKPQRLFAGEVVRDAHCNGGARTISICDPKNPNVVLWSGALGCPPANENVTYVIKIDARGGIVIETQKTAHSGPSSSPK